MSHHHPIDGVETRLRCAASEGCAESRLLLSRRSMLGVTAGLFSWAFMPSFAEAASTDGDPRLLVVVLRGGLDGISAVVPHGDRHYVPSRGALAIPKSSTMKLNSFFGLHPALKNFGAYYKNNEAAVVHATCVPLRNRSHFDAQDNLENGMPGRTTNATGWLNRLLSVLPAGAPIKARGAVEVGIAPMILRGPAPVLGWSPARFAPLGEETRETVRALYAARDPELLAFLDRGLKANRLAEKLGVDKTDISLLRRGFRGAGRLVGAPQGPRIAVLSIEGWDTHAEQGGTSGDLADLLTELDTGLNEFKAEAGASWRQTVVLLVTEFGRTVESNGNSGTDHGVGTVALLAGGAVNGGRVFGDWPGLAPAKLYQNRDLMPTTDLRSVFKGVLRDHLGVPMKILNTTLFPESSAARPLNGLIKTSTASVDSLAYQNLAYGAARAETPIARFRKAQQLSAASLA